MTVKYYDRCTKRTEVPHKVLFDNLGIYELCNECQEALKVFLRPKPEELPSH